MRLSAALLLLATLAAAARAEGTLRGRLQAGTKANLEGAVVWIEGGEKLPALAHEPSVRVMSQIHKTFSPAALAVRSGDGVSFENLDNVFHNVFSLDKANPFDLGLYKGKKHFASDGRTEDAAGSTIQPFKTPGKFLIFCNIHPDMVGAVYSFDHGYFAQADQNGLFTLPLPPPGTYTLVVDGPTLDKPARREVTVTADNSLLEVSLKARAAPKRVSHRRKNGEPYVSDDSSGDTAY